MRRLLDAALAIGVWIAWILACSGSADPKTTIGKVDADVAFTGSQFTVKNPSTVPWTDVELEVNYETFSKGYIFRAGRIGAGETIKIGALQFAKPDGTRLNPLQVKPLKMSVTVKLPNGQTAMYFGSWN